MCVHLNDLRGFVHSQQEASALRMLDMNAIRRDATIDHLMSCCAHAQVLESHVACAFAYHVVVHMRIGLNAVCSDVRVLLTHVDGLDHTTAGNITHVRLFAAVNHSFATELLRETCVPLSTAKQRLWSVEETICHEIASADRKPACAAHIPMAQGLPFGPPLLPR